MLLFFMYGTSVNHVAEWNILREEWRTELKGFGLDEATVHDIVEPIPTPHVDTVVAKGVSKVQAELVDTVSVSAKAWIPINLMNFALFPPHLRPLVFSTASVFWNCYLSLAMYANSKWKRRFIMMERQYNNFDMNNNFASWLASRYDATNFHHGEQFFLQLARFVHIHTLITSTLSFNDVYRLTRRVDDLY